MELVKGSEVRALLKISPATLYRLLDCGLPSIGKGRLRHFEREAIVQWFARYAALPRIPPRTYRCARCGAWWQLGRGVPPRSGRCRCGGELVAITAQEVPMPRQGQTR